MNGNTLLKQPRYRTNYKLGRFYNSHRIGSTMSHILYQYLFNVYISWYIKEKNYMLG